MAAAAAAAAAAVVDGAAETAASRADGGTGAEGRGAKAAAATWFSAEPLDGVPGRDLGDDADDLALGDVLPPGGEDGEVGVTGADEVGGRPMWGGGGKAAPPAAAAAAMDWACARARAG